MKMLSRLIPFVHLPDVQRYYPDGFLQRTLTSNAIPTLVSRTGKILANLDQVACAESASAACGNDVLLDESMQCHCPAVVPFEIDSDRSMPCLGSAELDLAWLFEASHPRSTRPCRRGMGKEMPC